MGSAMGGMSILGASVEGGVLGRASADVDAEARP